MTQIIQEMESIMSLLLFSALLLGFAAVNQCAPTKRNMPVIGILLQESYPEVLKHGDTYFQDSYVKWLQTGGAKVVPIRTNETVGYYTDLMGKINGVLLPGGDVDTMTSAYAKAAQIIYKLVIEFNNAGSYFPLWGTCLGFEELMYLQTGKNLLTKCDAFDLMLPLEFTQSWLGTKLFIKAENSIPTDLTRLNITANYHENCTTLDSFKASPELSGFFRLVSTNKDRNGLDFVSMMEAYKYPIYGNQWHPEMNPFDMSYKEHVPHTLQSVQASQYLATFFVDEARKSDHQFLTMEEESKAVIENYKPVFLGPPGFYNFYFFNITKMAT
ncbi:gamma-glutamyl hydrolase-like [Lineus longissimus]|uniref:gamma-glutamyl hydrolase-like n=1 Tax=Lineus longissimus TaxID=88925 RepID=UPI00315CC1B8